MKDTPWGTKTTQTYFIAAILVDKPSSLDVIMASMYVTLANQSYS